MWSTRAQLATLLRNAAVRGGGGGYGPLRRAMVVAQVALSLVLLSAGGLVVRSFERLLRVDPGFSTAGVLTLGVPDPRGALPEGRADAGGARAAAPRARGDPRRHGRGRGGGAPPQRRPEPVAPSGSRARRATRATRSATDRSSTSSRRARATSRRSASASSPAARSSRRQPGGVREAVIDRTLARQFYPTGSAGRGDRSASSRTRSSSWASWSTRGSTTSTRTAGRRSICATRTTRSTVAQLRAAQRPLATGAGAGGAVRDPAGRPAARRLADPVDGRDGERGAAAAAPERGAPVRRSRSARCSSRRWASMASSRAR